MALYLKYGDNIKGDVTEDAHRGWIELTSFQWGSGPSVTDATVTKKQDSASSALFKESLTGSGVNAVLDFVKTDEPTVYLRLEMSNTMISSFTTSGSGDNPTESLTLNFASVTATNTPGTPPP